MKHGDSATNQTSQLFLPQIQHRAINQQKENKGTQMQAIQGNNTASGILLIKREHKQTKMPRHNKQGVEERKIPEMN